MNPAAYWCWANAALIPKLIETKDGIVACLEAIYAVHERAMWDCLALPTAGATAAPVLPCAALPVPSCVRSTG